MARPNVGMMYPVFAPLVSHKDGSMPVYGTGVVIQEARNATITKTYNDNPLYELMGERQGTDMRTFILPVVPKRCDHLRFKITGHGEAKIYDLSRIMEVGGDGV